MGWETVLLEVIRRKFNFRGPRGKEKKLSLHLHLYLRILLCKLLFIFRTTMKTESLNF